MADVPLIVTSEFASAERRVTPSWSIAQLKAKLEPVTGIPPSAQRLYLKAPGRSGGAGSSAGEKGVELTAPDEEAVQVGSFGLVSYAELVVSDTRPASARPNLNDTSGVDKYVMPDAAYEARTDSVLAWKKASKLGRFDPDAARHEAERSTAHEREAKRRDIEVGKRCRVGGDDNRRGTVMYVGDVPEIAAAASSQGAGDGWWVGVRLDEPVGKNDGSINGKRYWGEGDDEEGLALGPPGARGMKHGVFVRPDRVEVGDFPVQDDLAEEMEEI